MSLILIIDDEESIRVLLENFLTRLGYQVHVAKDGKEGISLLSCDHKYEVVLTDISMPNIDGYDVARHIRASGMPQIPIVAITGLSESTVQKNLFDLVLIKPFSFDRLRLAIKSIIPQKESRLMRSN